MEQANIQFFGTENIGPNFDQGFAKKGLTCLGEQENKKITDVNFILLNDEELRVINRDYLNHDDYTDVISFDLAEEKNVEGEVYLSYDRIKENSFHYGVSSQNEFNRVMIHGMLHLIGYTDGTDEGKNEMRTKEDYYLQNCFK